MTYCFNTACPAQFARLFMHFVSRGAMDIEGMGERLALAVIDAGLVNDVGDLYSITREQLLSLERMGEKSADNLMRSIELSKNRPLASIIYALGIRHVGYETADALVRHFGSMDSIAEASEENLTSVPGIGPKVAQSIAAHFSQESSQAVIRKLHQAGVRLETDATAQDVSGLTLTGLQMVVTGRLDSMSRSQAEDRIKELGGSVGSSVSKKTRYLVVGEDPGSKLEQAQKLGTQILDEAQFLKLLEGSLVEEAVS